MSGAPSTLRGRALKGAKSAAPPRDEAASAAHAGAALPRLSGDFARLILLYALSAALLYLIFPPRSTYTWPLAFFCLVPWGVATCVAHRAWVVHWLGFPVGWAYFLAALHWLYPVTGLGYAALAFYLAIYWTLAAWAIRTGLRHGISPVWTLPVTWVACEFLRGWVMTGFPWLFLSHGLTTVIPLIQISDITGAYGVSFLAAMVNGLLVDIVLRRVRPTAGGPRRFPVSGAIVTGAAVAGTLIYGYVRLAQSDFRPGPRVAVLQHDFVLHSKPPYTTASSTRVLAEYVNLAAQAAQHKPDLVVFPETVWGSTQNKDFLKQERRAVSGHPAGAWAYGAWCERIVSALARGDYATVNEELSRVSRAGTGEALPQLPEASGPPVALVVGSTSLELFPDAVYPKSKRYNSALIYDADGRQRDERYDKMHLVVFGEVVPFRYGKLHWLYRRLNELSPFSNGGKDEYSLEPGRNLTVFELSTAGGAWRFGTPICYEDVMAYLIRRYVWQGGSRRVDFLVNISNDGWFLHGDELPQHLAICSLRAVENRVAIARSVNTGISGFIDPNGRILSRVERDGRWSGPGVIGYDLQTVPIDSRTSLYGRYGDWFALLCVAGAAALWLAAIGERWIHAARQRLRSMFQKGAV